MPRELTGIMCPKLLGVTVSGRVRHAVAMGAAPRGARTKARVGSTSHEPFWMASGYPWASETECGFQQTQKRECQRDTTHPRCASDAVRLIVTASGFCDQRPRPQGGCQDQRADRPTYAPSSARQLPYTHMEGSVQTLTAHPTRGRRKRSGPGAGAARSPRGSSCGSSYSQCPLPSDRASLSEGG